MLGFPKTMFLSKYSKKRLPYGCVFFITNFLDLVEKSFTVSDTLLELSIRKCDCRVVSLLCISSFVKWPMTSYAATCAVPQPRHSLSLVKIEITYLQGRIHIDSFSIAQVVFKSCVFFSFVYSLIILPFLLIFLSIVVLSLMPTEMRSSEKQRFSGSFSSVFTIFIPLICQTVYPLR